MQTILKKKNFFFSTVLKGLAVSRLVTAAALNLLLTITKLLLLFILVVFLLTVLLILVFNYLKSAGLYSLPSGVAAPAGSIGYNLSQPAGTSLFYDSICIFTNVIQNYLLDPIGSIRNN